MRRRITAALVESLWEVDKRTSVRDDQVIGFHVTAHPSGHRSFHVDHGPRSRRRRTKLGSWPVMSVEAARARAIEVLEAIAVEPPPEPEPSDDALTLSDWIAEYLGRVRDRKKQPRHDEGYLREVEALWGQRPLRSLKRSEVVRAMQRVARRGNTTANRWLASVRACLAEAVRDGLIELNPAGRIRPLRENPPRRRVLSDEELSRVVVAIEALPDRFARIALLVLVHTGMRKSEVLRARWSDVDLERRDWHLPSPKSGRPEAIPLTDEVVALLESLPRIEGSPWVIPSRDPGRPRSDLKHAWARVRREAGVFDVTLHDLRRTYGLAATKELGIFVASKLLRHSDVRVTQRHYAPLLTADLRAPVEDLAAARSVHLQPELDAPVPIEDALEDEPAGGSDEALEDEVLGDEALDTPVLDEDDGAVPQSGGASGDGASGGVEPAPITSAPEEVLPEEGSAPALGPGAVAAEDLLSGVVERASEPEQGTGSPPGSEGVLLGEGPQSDPIPGTSLEQSPPEGAPLRSAERPRSWEEEMLEVLQRAAAEQVAQQQTQAPAPPPPRWIPARLLRPIVAVPLALALLVAVGWGYSRSPGVVAAGFLDAAIAGQAPEVSGEDPGDLPCRSYWIERAEAGFADVRVEHPDPDGGGEMQDWRLFVAGGRVVGAVRR